MARNTSFRTRRTVSKCVCTERPYWYHLVYKTIMWSSDRGSPSAWDTPLLHAMQGHGSRRTIYLATILSHPSSYGKGARYGFTICGKVVQGKGALVSPIVLGGEYRGAIWLIGCLFHLRWEANIWLMARSEERICDSLIRRTQAHDDLSRRSWYGTTR